MSYHTTEKQCNALASLTPFPEAFGFSPALHDMLSEWVEKAVIYIVMRLFMTECISLIYILGVLGHCSMIPYISF